MGQAAEAHATARDGCLPGAGVAGFGDQFSDLAGEFADKTFKLPNPNYFL